MPLAELTLTPAERGDTNRPGGKKLPFGPFDSFAACESKMTPKYGAESAKKICGSMQERMEKKSDEGYSLMEIPPDAQSLFSDTFAEHLSKGSDEDASWRIAWANVHRHYEKTISGKWIPLKAFDNISFKSLIKSDRIVYGDASVAMVDSDGEMITEDALKTAFNSYITRGHVLFYHRNIPIGEVLPSYKTADGKVLKSGVEDKSLKVVVRVYKDTKKADEVWDAIERGDLRAFSIGGEVIGEPVHVCANEDCSKSYRRIDQIDLHEISIVPNPANEASYFNVIKSKVEKQDPHVNSDKDSSDDDTASGKDYYEEKASEKLKELASLINDEMNKALNCPKFTKKANRIIQGDSMTDETKKDDFQERVLKELAEMRKTMSDSTNAKPKVRGGPMSQSSESADDNKEGTEKAKAPAASSSSDEEAVQKYAKDIAELKKAIADLAALVTKPTAPAPEVKKEEKPAEPPAPKIEVGEKKGVVPPNPLPGVNPDSYIDFSSPMWKAGEFDPDSRDRRALDKVQDLIAKAKGGR